jgi:hypothetical protein
MGGAMVNSQQEKTDKQLPTLTGMRNKCSKVHFLIGWSRESSIVVLT